MKLNSIKMYHFCIVQSKICSILCIKELYMCQQFLFEWGNQCLKFFSVDPPTNFYSAID